MPGTFSRPASAQPSTQSTPVAAHKPGRGSGGAARFPDPIRLSGGRPLPPTTRERLESSFGRPLDHVRVHTDATAASLAEAHAADAVTTGGSIAFATSRFQPETAAGLSLLAHEVAHVVQQGATPGPATAHPRKRSGGLIEPGVAAAERAADHAAARVVRGELAGLEPGGLAWTTRDRLLRRARAGSSLLGETDAGYPAAAEPADLADDSPWPLAELAAEPAVGRAAEWEVTAGVYE